MKRFMIRLLSSLLVLSPATAFAQDDAQTAPLPPPATPEASPTPAPAPPAYASQPAPEEAPPPAAQPTTPMERFRVNAGAKVAYVGTDGFDTFADSNTLGQFSVDGTYMLWSAGRVGLAAGLGWDVGGRGDKLRGLDTSLTTHRFLVPIEARVSVTPWIWAFGKAAPGAAYMFSKIEDPSSPRSLSATGWAFATDLSAGATFALGKRETSKRGIRFLITPEVGYSFTTATSLSANPGREEDELLGSDADTKLRSVALSGFFWRTTVGVAF